MPLSNFTQNRLANMAATRPDTTTSYASGSPARPSPSSSPIAPIIHNSTLNIDSSYAGSSDTVDYSFDPHNPTSRVDSSYAGPFDILGSLQLPPASRNGGSSHRRLLSEDIEEEGDKIPTPVPSIDDLLNPHQSGVATDTKFLSLEHAISYFTTQGAAPDETIPLHDSQKRAIVKALMDAIKNVEHAEDNIGMVRPFLNNKYSDARIEIACWNILHSCIAMHTQGSLLARYDIERKASKHYVSFGKRLEVVILSLMTQKTICKHVLDPFYLHQFVEDPSGSVKRVACNKTLNKRKGEVMAAGKALLGTPQPSSSSPAASSTPSRSSMPVTPTPRSRTRSTISPGATSSRFRTPENLIRSSPAALHTGSPVDASPSKKARVSNNLSKAVAVRASSTGGFGLSLPPLGTHGSPSSVSTSVDTPVGHGSIPLFMDPPRSPLPSEFFQFQGPSSAFWGGTRATGHEASALPEHMPEQAKTTQVAKEADDPKVGFAELLDDEFFLWEGWATQDINDAAFEANYPYLINPDFGDHNLDS